MDGSVWIAKSAIDKMCSFAERPCTVDLLYGSEKGDPEGPPYPLFANGSYQNLLTKFF